MTAAPGPYATALADYQAAKTRAAEATEALHAAWLRLTTVDRVTVQAPGSRFAHAAHPLPDGRWGRAVCGTRIPDHAVRVPTTKAPLCLRCARRLIDRGDWVQ